MTDTAANLRALADRPTPKLTLDHPWNPVEHPDAATTTDWRATDAASNRYATRRAAAAAQMLRTLFPAAHRVVFERTEESDSVVRVDLLTIRTTAGTLIWYDDTFAKHPDAVALAEAEAHGGSVRPRIDAATRGAIEELIADAEDTGRGYFSSADEAPHPDAKNTEVFPPGDLRELVIADELAALATLRVDSIDLDRLADLLRRETAVIDPADVDALMATIRQAAGAAQDGIIPAVTVDADALRAWLSDPDGPGGQYQVTAPGWEPRMDNVADLVDALGADDSPLAHQAWRLSPDLTQTFTHRIGGGAYVFGADAASGGRIVTLPQDDRHLPARGPRTGPDAAIEALTYLAALLDRAHGH